MGTRYGEFAFTLVEAMPEGSEVIGLECDPKTVEEAREKNGGKGITFVQGEGAHMDFPDDSFELVAISNTLHHIEDYDAVLKEMLRVLKPGGWFLVNEMTTRTTRTRPSRPTSSSTPWRPSWTCSPADSSVPPGTGRRLWTSSALCPSPT